MTSAEYVTFLRDFSGRVHAGNAEANTSMPIARRPFNSDAAFRQFATCTPSHLLKLKRSVGLPGALVL